VHDVHHQPVPVGLVIEEHSFVSDPNVPWCGISRTESLKRYGRIHPMDHQIEGGAGIRAGDTIEKPHRKGAFRTWELKLPSVVPFGVESDGTDISDFLCDL